jgi:hypothetical protein
MSVPEKSFNISKLHFNVPAGAFGMPIAIISVTSLLKTRRFAWFVYQELGLTVRGKESR